MEKRMETKIYTGIDIGGTFIRMGILDLDLNALDFTVSKSDLIQNSDNPLETLEQHIKEYIDRHIGLGKLAGIGLGIPGTVKKEEGIATSIPNVRSLENLKIIQYLQNAFQVPVILENDVSLLLIYEIKKRSLEKSRCIIGIFVGTGLGNAIYLNGQIWEGFNGAAAELGHIPVLGSNTECPCGKRGCIEPYSSGKRLVEIYHNHFEQDSYEDLFTKHGTSQIVKEFIDSIAVAIATEIVILDPEYVVIGGGVVSMKDFPSEQLESRIVKHIKRYNQADNTKFLYTHEDKWAGVIGAVYKLHEDIISNL
jgi:allose kinase